MAKQQFDKTPKGSEFQKVKKKKNMYNQYVYTFVPCKECDNLILIPKEDCPPNPACKTCGGNFPLLVNIKSGDEVMAKSKKAATKKTKAITEKVITNAVESVDVNPSPAEVVAQSLSIPTESDNEKYQTVLARLKSLPGNKRAANRSGKLEAMLTIATSEFKQGTEIARDDLHKILIEKSPSYAKKPVGNNWEMRTIIGTENVSGPAVNPFLVRWELAGLCKWDIEKDTVVFI